MRRGNSGPPTATALPPEEVPDDDEGSFEEPRTRVATYPSLLPQMLERSALDEFSVNDAPTRESKNMVAALAAHDALIESKRLAERAPPPLAPAPVPPPLSVRPQELTAPAEVTPPAEITPPDEIPFGDEMPHLRRTAAGPSRTTVVLLCMTLGIALVAAGSLLVQRRHAQVGKPPSAIIER
jgi:hypothetical protein